MIQDNDGVQGASATPTGLSSFGSSPAVSPVPASIPSADFQNGVDAWMDVCFGVVIKADLQERCDRFIEEALEFVQAAGYSADRAHALVDYTFGRPQGEINQEVGGVMVTLAAMCNTLGVDIGAAAETELARVWTKVEAIRAKQAAKPTGSALPIAKGIAAGAAETPQEVRSEGQEPGPQGSPETSLNEELIAELVAALQSAATFIEALADNEDPNEPIADNGMTIVGALQFQAPALAFKVRGALAKASRAQIKGAQ